MLNFIRRIKNNLFRQAPQKDSRHSSTSSTETSSYEGSVTETEKDYLKTFTQEINKITINPQKYKGVVIGPDRIRQSIISHVEEICGNSALPKNELSKYLSATAKMLSYSSNTKLMHFLRMEALKISEAGKQHTKKPQRP